MQYLAMIQHSLKLLDQFLKGRAMTWTFLPTSPHDIIPKIDLSVDLSKRMHPIRHHVDHTCRTRYLDVIYNTVVE